MIKFVRTRTALLPLCLAISFAGLAPAPAALAAAPMVKASAPGYYRLMVGDFEVTALSDGTTTLPANNLLAEMKPAELNQALAKSYLTTNVETSFNAYLVNTGDKLVLIDTGMGKVAGPSLGHLLDNLKAAGYQPEQVDEIYITHMHSDHIGGLSDSGQRLFPNAILRADKAEAGFYLNPEGLATANAKVKESMERAMAMFKPYMDAGKFQTFEADAELVPGVRSLANHGHTPGHNSYVVESKGQKLVVWGDLIHVASAQLGDPASSMMFDGDKKKGAEQRIKAYRDAANGHYLIAGAHISFPGIGHVRSEGKGFVWVPVNYSLVHP